MILGLALVVLLALTLFVVALRVTESAMKAAVETMNQALQKTLGPQVAEQAEPNPAEELYSPPWDLWEPGLEGDGMPEQSSS